MTAKSLTVQKRADGVALLTLSTPGEERNLLRPELIEAFGELLGELESDPAVKAVVLASGKPEHFVAGADVSMLQSLASVEEGVAMSRRAQLAMDRIEQSPLPIVAAIHGYCVGGGTELALACSARVCSDAPQTFFSLPEVQLGLLPGAGGTQRLPRLIGMGPALDMMLTGRRIRAKRAKQLGLVQETTRASVLLEVAARWALDLAAKKTNRRSVLRDWLACVDKTRCARLLLQFNPVARKLYFRQAMSTVLRKTRGHYPAPLRILNAVELGLEKGLELGFLEEAAAFGELLASPQSKALVALFFASTAAKRKPEGDYLRIRRVGVVGAGLMGAGIATVSAIDAGCELRLMDTQAQNLGRAVKAISKACAKAAKRGKLSRGEAQQARARVTCCTDSTGLENCDLVIEAVFEKLELKREILAGLEGRAKRLQLFASNTSALPIAEIARDAAHPEQVLGLHYFSPVEKMPLVEIVVTPLTAEAAVSSAVELCLRQGKLPIVVSDGPGFYTTRILGAYLTEASRILAEGVSIEHIDAAVKDWGFPVGAMALIDEVGIDVVSKVGPALYEAFGERFQPPAVLAALVADERLGRKNGRGFYDYRGKRKKVDSTVYGVLSVRPNKRIPAEEIAQRCALMMINEAVRCLDEGVLRSARDGDLGAVMGLGFPPWRGGPFHYIEQQGAQQVALSLLRLANRFGPRFEAAEGLKALGTRQGLSA